MPDIPVLYVFKHESAFETVEQPMLFKHPAVFAKEAAGYSNSRSEEHTSELQSLMRISYAVFCLKKKTKYNSRRNRIWTADSLSTRKADHTGWPTREAETQTY